MRLYSLYVHLAQLWSSVNFYWFLTGSFIISWFHAFHLQLLQLLPPGSLWVPVHPTLPPAASPPHLVSPSFTTHTHTHTSRTEAAVIVVTCSKEQIHWWEPRVSSSHPDLAEGHRGLFWQSPQEDGEGEQAAPGGGG